MINKVLNINFKNQSNLRENKKYAATVSIKPLNQDEIISNLIDANMNENYSKGRMLEKFASIYEKSGKPQIANSLYKRAVDSKEQSTAPIFEIFKSYIALQKTYQDMGDIKKADQIEDFLNNKIKEVDNIKKEEISPDEILVENNAFSKIALMVCQKLLNSSQYDAATAIFNTLEDEIKKNSINMNELEILYKKTKAEILYKNNSFKKSEMIYEELAKKEKNSDYIYQIIENKLSNGNKNDVENLLNKTFNYSNSPENIVKNLFYRATFQLNNDNQNLGVKFLNLAYLISKITDSDIKPELNILVALTLQHNNETEKSNEVCKKTLEYLQKKDKIYSKQYIQTLVIMASNYFSQYLNNPNENNEILSTAKSTYLNAYKISQAIGDNYSKVLVTADMAEIALYEGNKEKAISFAEATLKNTNQDAFKAKAYGVLGKIARKDQCNHLSLEHFENQRKHLVLNNSPLPLIKENVQNIIDIYKDFGMQDKVEEYNQILLQEGSARFQDLMELGNAKIKSAEFEKAQEYFEKAASLENETDSAKAIAQVHIGIAKLNTLNDKMAIIDIENGCKNLERIAKNNEYKNPKETKNFIDILNFTGDFYYFNKAQYNDAANIFVKIVDILNEQKSINLPEEFIKKAKLKAGASLYKAKRYDEALPYYMNILREITEDKKLSIESLNEDFIKKIVETKSRNGCSRVASALEIMGVINAKMEYFTSAKICFETAKKIREDAGGNRLLLARNYRALSRLSMINDFDDAKYKLEKAIELLKSELGAKSEEVIKEETFKNNYFGASLTSAGKYITRGWGKAKKIVGLKDNFKKEIIDDFHLIYEDMALCE